MTIKHNHNLTNGNKIDLLIDFSYLGHKLSYKNNQEAAVKKKNKQINLGQADFGIHKAMLKSTEYQYTFKQKYTI